MRTAPAALALLTACGEPPSLSRGLPSSVAMPQVNCTRLQGEDRDWCALQALSISRSTGEDAWRLCQRLQTDLARDRCIESAARCTASPVADELCDEIRSARFRESCWVTVALRHAADSWVVAEDACRRAGTQRATCLEALVVARTTTMRHDPGRITADLAGLLPREPALAHSARFGEAVGEAARSIGLLAGVPGPCDAFPYGSGRLACLYTLVR